MRKSRSFVASCLGIAVVVTALAAGCGGATTKKTTPSDSSATPASTTPDKGASRVFTAEELATFDGLDGQPAYVAVDGVVYDVTRSTLWSGGNHNVCPAGARAGRDLSEVIKQSPDMYAKVKQFPVVGSLEQ